ncbi:MAG: methyltransferase domain-containing protein [Myxococcales bacterium]|nr:methyltransferase domain-containing protein [Myxococcales bacterium]
MRRPTLLDLLFTMAAACATTPTVPAGADPAINAPFRDAALDVKVWTDRFEGESREVYRAREAIVAAIGLEPGMVVADVGTGTGLFVKYFSERVGPTGRVVAVDIAETFLALVRERAAAAGLTNVETRLGTTDSAQIPAGSVDVAFVCDTYHHFETPTTMLASLQSALRSGGRLIIVDYHRIPGKTSEFLMGHVRANRETVISEIEAAGFVRLQGPPAPFLDENYLVVFERP